MAAAWAADPVAASDAPGARLALVIGNASYPQSPLLNPVHDADAVAALLKRAGFSVDKRINASQKDLREAAVRFGEAIRGPNVKFALFYYAGHGMQLDWRNYLIPVNLTIRTADDVRSQAVDVSDLLRSMQQTQGKNYLVILDACRDNPFGAAYQPAAKGLTQFDAPTGSLLAYSTAPGKVAMDGAGANGLYTSHLVQEFGVPGAKVEDVFKRVRLNVRLASKGQQVPWESTSLEEDLYLFPTARQQLTEAQREALLDEELARWAQVKTAQTIDPLAEFIRQFPSGSTSELAQARLTRMLTTQSELAMQQALAQQQAEARQLQEQQAEARRLQEQQALAQAMARQREEAQRLAEQKRLALEVRLAQQKKMTEETRLAEQLLAQARADAQRVAAARDAAEREAAERRLAQAQAQAEAQRAEQARLQALAQAREIEIAQAQARQEALLREAQARLEAQQQQEKLAALHQPKPIEPAPTQPAAAQPVTVAYVSTPYSQGYADHQRHYRAGDEYVFRMLDGFSGREIPLEASGVRTPLRIRVTKVDTHNDRVEFNGGEYVTDLMGNTLKHLTGTFDEPRQFYPAELYIGKHWKSEFRQARTNGLRYTFRYKLRVVAREKITVPAGTFDAFRIEAEGFNMQLSASLSRKIWVVPGISADIASETLVRLRNGDINQFDRQELVRYPAGPVLAVAGS